jgi:hypothetical protein
MKQSGVLILLALTLSACTINYTIDTDTPDVPLGWLSGCWQTDDGVEETWVRSKQGDQIFGYSVVSQNGERVFFEQMRVDILEGKARFHAYPKGVGPTAFEGALDDPNAIEFINASNDFPQRIRYAFVDGRIEATTALMDNSNENAWRYERCD